MDEKNHFHTGPYALKSPEKRADTPSDDHELTMRILKTRASSRWGGLILTTLTTAAFVFSITSSAHAASQQLIPVLGVTMGDRPVGAVAYVIVSVDRRPDHDGLAVHFINHPGRFSPMAQTAVEQAIYRAARSLGLSTDSWTVTLRFPYPGLTLYGVSLSAMVSLSAIALASGAHVASDRVITGTVTPDGHIGAVGSVGLKIDAARDAHVRRVLVPDEQDITTPEWHTPFLMHVSPVDSVEQAYRALTEPDCAGGAGAEPACEGGEPSAHPLHARN
jgi:predicted S18 family serine protease